MKGSKVICVDFDGTCTSYKWPLIGEDIGAVPVLKKLIENGHKIILYTMRDKEALADAVAWFKENNVPLYGVNFNPAQASWNSSNKIYANLYIDDAALGCPLIYPKDEKPYVDWVAIRKLLSKSGYITEE